MSLVRSGEAQIAYSDYQAALANGAEIDSGWLDMSKADKVQITGYSDTPGLTIVISSRADASQTPLITPVTYDDGPLYLVNIICRQQEMRFQWQNNTGAGVNDASLEIKLTFGGSDKLSVFPVGIQPSDFSQASLVQSILRGRDTDGVYRNVAVDEIGALLTADFGTEVARGLYEGYKVNTKFGRNSDIDVGVEEDVWNGGGLYTGFDATTGQRLELFSNNAADTGSLVSSGTATGGSLTTLIDSGATFISDGVAVGDLVINDTKQAHGVISSVDSETQVTIFDLTDGIADLLINESGDAYRIATATSTGAAVIKINAMLDSNYDEFSEYIILNGTTGVFTVGTDYIRQSRGRILLAGSFGTNEGEVTSRQETDTANVMMVMPAESGQTAICCATVPRGKFWIIKRLYAAMVRANGSLGGAGMRLLVRQKGGAWQTKRFPTISNSLPYNIDIIGGIILPEGTDIKWNIQSVSDANTSVDSEFEYFEIDVM